MHDLLAENELKGDHFAQICISNFIYLIILQLSTIDYEQRAQLNAVNECTKQYQGTF